MFTTKGFIFLEVMLSLFFISFVLIAMERLLFFATTQTHHIYYRGIAERQFQQLTERLTMVGDKAGVGEQIMQWQRQNQQLFNHPTSQVLGHYPHYQISLCYFFKEKVCISQVIDIDPTEESF